MSEKIARIGVWCTVSSTEYDLLRLTLKPMLNNNHIEKILIVVTGPSKPNSFGYLSGLSSKVIEEYKYFGYGYGRSVEDGGYNQIDARNYALKKICSHDLNWVLQFDADDFYTSSFFNYISSVGEDKNYICCACYTLNSINTFWYKEKIDRSHNGRMLLNPHIRMWRKNIGLSYSECDNANAVFTNRTRHCNVDFPMMRDREIEFICNPMHFHLHNILRKKHHKSRVDSRKFDYELPGELLDCISHIKVI